jgi:TIR domain/WD domain, G-beta repeat
MADVFISYANENRDTARKLAASLEAHGWSVWWDRKIRAGQSFDQVIERELEAARSVVVLWSKDSISSEWVRNEAALAAERGVLVPVFIDDVKPPLEFRRRQAADLVGWDNDPSHPGFQATCDAIAVTTNITGLTPSPSASALAGALHQKRRWILASVAAIAVALGAYWIWTGTLKEQDVSGYWDLEPSEKMHKTYIDLRVVDGKLVGSEVTSFPLDPLTVMSGLKREAAIVDGKVVRDRISFKTRRTYMRMPPDESTRTEVTHQYEGRIDGGKIHFAVSNQDGQHWEVTAVRRSDDKPAELVAKLEGHRGFLEQLTPLSEGRLASASRDQTVKIWNLSTLEAEASFAHGSQVRGVVALSDGRLASAESDGKVRIWNLQTKKLEASFQELPGLLYRVAMLPDGRLAGGYSGGEIALWNTASGTIEKTLKVGDAWVLRLASLRDGRVAVGLGEGTIEVWRLTK